MQRRDRIFWGAIVVLALVYPWLVELAGAMKLMTVPVYQRLGALVLLAAIGGTPRCW